MQRSTMSVLHVRGRHGTCSLYPVEDHAVVIMRRGDSGGGGDARESDGGAAASAAAMTALLPGIAAAVRALAAAREGPGGATRV